MASLGASKKVVLVTGANKGIGFAIVEQLCKISGLHILLGARDQGRGQEAVKQLTEAGFKNVTPFRIDLDDDKSITAAANDVKQTYGGLDILINNAGIAFKGDEFNENVARVTNNSNYYGTLKVCQAFLPLMRENGRVVNVASRLGERTLGGMSKSLSSQFLDGNLTINKLNALVEKFIADVKSNKYAEEGWPKTAYGVSKAAVISLNRILARDNKTKNLLINSCCPGWVRTDMAGPKAPLTPTEGAETPIYLALLEGDGKGGPSGLFFFEKKPIVLS